MHTNVSYEKIENVVMVWGFQMAVKARVHIYHNVRHKENMLHRFKMKLILE